MANWTVPDEIIRAVDQAQGENATLFSRSLAEHLGGFGEIAWNQPVADRGDGRKGFVEMTLQGHDGGTIGIQTDPRQPQQRSISKLQTFDRWLIVVRDHDAGGISEQADTSKRLPTTPQAKRFASIFHRKLTTPWSPKEIRAYKALGIIPEDDLAAVEAHYAANWPPGPKNFLRRDLGTFINNFPGEVERARNAEAAQKSDTTKRTPKEL